MGKTRDIFKKTGNLKGTFHARTGMIKDRNGKNLTEAERLRRNSKNTLSRKFLMTQITMMMLSLT